MTEAITKTDIKNFNNDGVVVLRGVFNDWIETVSYTHLTLPTNREV